MPPVQTSQTEEQQCGAQAAVVFISSPSDSDAPKHSGKKMNWLWGPNDLGYGPGPNTF